MSATVEQTIEVQVRRRQGNAGVVTFHRIDDDTTRVAVCS